MNRLFRRLSGIMMLVLGAILVPTSAAHADGGPAVEWTRNADATWTLVIPAENVDETKEVKASEVKDIGSTPQKIFCGQNYQGAGQPGICKTNTFTFASNLVKNGKACAYVQVDWPAGSGYNSDDYLNCDPVPGPPVETCVGKDQVVHTFDAATASGSVSVKNGKKLCEPLYVKATTRTYDTPEQGIWPQTYFGANDYVLTEGTVQYQAPEVGCSQSDIYASWKQSDLNGIGAGSVLTGPGAPYEPPFLHEKSSGPNPTYLNRSTEGCGVSELMPVKPEVHTISKCGEYGSVTFAKTEGVVYTMTPADAREGKVTVLAAPEKPNQELSNSYDGPWVYDLGTYTECPLHVVKVTPVEPAVTVITKCGEYGSITPAVTKGVIYTVNPENAKVGLVTVSAAADKPVGETVYELDGYDGAWTYNLGFYEECVTATASTPVTTTDKTTESTTTSVTTSPTTTSSVVITTSTQSTTIDLSTAVTSVNPTVVTTSASQATAVATITSSSSAPVVYVPTAAYQPPAQALASTGVSNLTPRIAVVGVLLLLLGATAVRFGLSHRGKHRAKPAH